MWTVLVLATVTVALPPAPQAQPRDTEPAREAARAEAARPADDASGADERLAQARVHSEAGRRAEAILLLDAMLEENAGDELSVRILLSDVQLAAGDHQGAVHTLTSATEPDAEVLLLAGRAFKTWGDAMSARGARRDDIGFAYDEARGWLGLAAEAAPVGDTRAVIEIGFFELYVANDADAAISSADGLLEITPEHGDALLLRGCAGLFLSLRDADSGQEEAAAVLRGRAIQDLVGATRHLPESRPEPWVQLAWLYEADDQPRRAVQAAVEILERVDEPDLSMIYHLARRYAAESRWEPAAEALHQMTRRRPEELTGHLRAEEDTTAVARTLGWAAGAMVNAGSIEEARDTLAAVVAADPQDGDLWNNYGFLCRETREYETAYTAYEKALAFQPDNPRLLNDTGLLLHYYLHRDYDHAVDLYERAVEMAEAGLKAEELTDEQRAELELARTDAIGNLTKLAAGDYDWP